MRKFIKLAVATLAGVSIAAIPARASNDYALATTMWELLPSPIPKPKPLEGEINFALNQDCNLIFDAWPFAPELFLSNTPIRMDVRHTVTQMLRQALRTRRECMDGNIKNIIAITRDGKKLIGAYRILNRKIYSRIDTRLYIRAYESLDF